MILLFYIDFSFITEYTNNILNIYEIINYKKFTEADIFCIILKKQNDVALHAVYLQNKK